VTGIAVRNQAARPGAGRIDTAIRISTAAAVLINAVVAAYISYWHAYTVVRLHGGTGITARLEPATIDGLVYASSMVILYAARHRHRVPGLARWFLGLGILATLAANMAQGWSSGPVGALIAAWPAVSLVGSYELLVWMVRTAAGIPDHEPAADQRMIHVQRADQAAGQSHRRRTRRPGAGPAGPETVRRPYTRSASPAGPQRVVRAAGPGQGREAPAGAACTDDEVRSMSGQAEVMAGEAGINAAAAAAYRASLVSGTPLSERGLAELFGRTSRRWARHRMAEGRQLASKSADDPLPPVPLRARSGNMEPHPQLSAGCA
jgi:Protein of unknown function (DUF2637)